MSWIIWKHCSCYNDWTIKLTDYNNQLHFDMVNRFLQRMGIHDFRRGFAESQVSIYRIQGLVDSLSCLPMKAYSSVSHYASPSSPKQRKCHKTGPRLNIKTVFHRYGDFHVKDKTIGEILIIIVFNRFWPSTSVCVCPFRGELWLAISYVSAETMHAVINRTLNRIHVSGIFDAHLWY